MGHSFLTVLLAACGAASSAAKVQQAQVFPAPRELAPGDTTMCPPRVGSTGGLWVNASLLSEEDMYLVFLYISADGLRGPAGAALWLDRTDTDNNVLLPDEVRLSLRGIEMYGNFAMIDTWANRSTDAEATRMAAYILPADADLDQYVAPSEATGGAIPALITSNALAFVIQTRPTGLARCSGEVLNEMPGDIDDVPIDEEELMPSPSPSAGAVTKPGGVDGAASGAVANAPFLCRLLIGAAAVATRSFMA